MDKKYNLSFHVIFIMNENIKWLEEFILYHSNLGFEHFYLYDNQGSTGGDGTKPIINTVLKSIIMYHTTNSKIFLQNMAI